MLLLASHTLPRFKDLHPCKRFRITSFINFLFIEDLQPLRIASFNNISASQPRFPPHRLLHSTFLIGIVTSPSPSCDISVIQTSSRPQVLCTLCFYNDGVLLTPWSVSSSTPHFHHLVVTHGCLHVGCESIKSTFMSSLLNLALPSHRPPSCFATPSSTRSFSFL